VSSKRWGNILAVSRDLAINLLGRVAQRTHVEPIREKSDVKGFKARWIGDPGERFIEIKTSTGDVDIKLEGNTEPAVEYIQDGDTRTVTISHIKDISCELDRETLDRIATPRGAGIAICVGAGAGLLGWLLLSALRSMETLWAHPKSLNVSPGASGANREHSENDPSDTQ